MQCKPFRIATTACILAVAGAMIAGCNDDDGSSGSASTSDGVLGRLYYEPYPAEVGETITISGSASRTHPSDPMASYTAVRDGSVAVASGAVSWPADGGAAPISFTDSLVMPGLHSYVVTLTSANGGSSSVSLDLPVAYNLSPAIAATAFSASEATLTLTLTNNGSGTVAFIVPYTVTTDTPSSPTIEYFDFASQPLAPGASRSRSATFALPLAATVTYIMTIDPLAAHGTNLAGMPATAQVVVPSGGG